MRFCNSWRRDSFSNVQKNCWTFYVKKVDAIESPYKLMDKSSALRENKVEIGVLRSVKTDHLSLGDRVL